MSKTWVLLSLVLLVILSGIIVYVSYNNSRLQDIIDKQDKLIKVAQTKDKDFLTQARGYKDSVKTFTEKIYYLNGSKKLTSNQLVSLFNHINNQKDSLERLLKNQQFLFNYAKELYSFDVFLTYKKNEIIANSNLSKADSAAIAYRFFKNRIKKTANGWSVDTFGDEEDKRKLRDALKKYKQNTLQDSVKKL